MFLSSLLCEKGIAFEMSSVVDELVNKEKKLHLDGTKILSILSEGALRAEYLEGERDKCREKVIIYILETSKC